MVPSITICQYAYDVTVLAFGNSVVLMVITGNLMEYTVNTLHLDFATAANMTSNLTGTSLLLPIFFGFLADAFFGPFWVIIGACVVYAAVRCSSRLIAKLIASLIAP